MKEKQIRLFTYLLLFTTSLLMLVAPIIPHHHHNDANHTVCMKNDWTDNSDSDSLPFHHSENPIQICSCTQTDQPTAPSNQLTLTPHLHLIAILFPNPLLEFISLEQKNKPTYFHYKEKITSQQTPSKTGLRVPPLFS